MTHSHDTSEEYSVGDWRYGPCFAYECAWSQRGSDPDTWEHHPSLGAARVRAASEAKSGECRAAGCIAERETGENLQARIQEARRLLDAGDLDALARWLSRVSP